MMLEPRTKKIDEWEVSSAVNTLIKVQEILKDKKLLPLVRREFKKRQDALAEAALELKVTKQQRSMGRN